MAWKISITQEPSEKTHGFTAEWDISVTHFGAYLHQLTQTLGKPTRRIKHQRLGAKK